MATGFLDQEGDENLENEMAEAAELSSEDLVIPAEPEVTGSAKYKQLLDAYNRLKPAQEQYHKDLRNANLIQGVNQIGQAFAAGRGAKIGDGSAAVQGLRDAAKARLGDVEQDINVAKNSMGAEKLGMDFDEAAKMNDPASDISTYYRQQAYAMLKKLSPENDYTGKLDNMSASQLAKLPGMKNIGANPQSPWIATDRVDRQGNPIRFNKVTGEYSRADGTTIQPGDETFRDILRKDELTGNYGLGNAKGMNLLPTNYGKPNDLTKDAQGQTTAQPREITYGEFAKDAPKMADEFNKMRDKFNADMKEPREVATSVTNLASKLVPGKNGEIDSGLLGPIQTQAAKMSGQKGVLTDQDLIKFAGAGGVKAKLLRIAEDLQGNMSEDDVKFFKRFAQLMGKSLANDIENRAELYADQGRQLVETIYPGVSNDNIKKWLSVDKVAPAVQNKKAVDSDTVTVKGPSGETAQMKKSVFEAKYKDKPGYSLVGK